MLSFHLLVSLWRHFETYDHEWADCLLFVLNLNYTLISSRFSVVVAFNEKAVDHIISLALKFKKRNKNIKLKELKKTNKWEMNII